MLHERSVRPDECELSRDERHYRATNAARLATPGGLTTLRLTVARRDGASETAADSAQPGRRGSGVPGVCHAAAEAYAEQLAKSRERAERRRPPPADGWSVEERRLLASVRDETGAGRTDVE